MLNNWGVPEILSAGAVLTVLVSMVLAVLLMFFSKGGKVRSGSVSIGNGDGSKQLPKHASCLHSKDILQVIARSNVLNSLRHTIPDEVIETQMKYYEEKEIELKSLMLRNFVSELNDADPSITDIVQHPEYLSYVTAITAMGRDLKDYIRVAMRQNHFASVSGDKWDEKKKRYRTAMFAMSTEFLNLYWRGTLVTRAMTYKINYSPEFVGTVNSICDAIFDYARDEALRGEKQIEAAEQEFERFLADTITG